ncbi:MAG: helix-turn-helix transcriptional regulator [Terriglobia bacterium]|jgi:transcriptional regulator with XRE-family HTH domain
MKESKPMLIGSRLRQLREKKHMSQGDIEDRIGLLRCYISRVENGYLVPSLQTLERFAAVLDVPLYQLFYCGEEVPPTPSLTPRKTLEGITAENGAMEGDGQFLVKLTNVLTRLAEPDRDVVLSLAKRLATRCRPPLRLANRRPRGRG